MFNILKTSKSLIFLVVLIPILTIMSYFIYVQISKTKVDIFHIIKNHIVEEKINMMSNYKDHILEQTTDIQEYFNVQDNDLSRNEKILSLIKSDKAQYLYILHKDSNGRFRYLIDVTQDEEEKAFYGQKFDPESDIWEKAYATAKVQVNETSTLDTLWVSVVYPIVIDEKVVAVIGADFTNKVYLELLDTLSPMEKISLYISVFMLVLLVLSYLLFYMYYKTRKKGFIDPLTLAYNREYLNVFLETNSLNKYHVLMIDLDHFKKVNDSFGHDVGDIVLRSVVNTISASIRSEDVLVRFGGEEFLLFIYKKDIKTSIMLANRIRKAVKEKPIFANSNTINVTLSIGLNPYPSRAKNIDEAIKIADEELYNAKTYGRDRVEVYSDENASQGRTSKRISDVQEALDDDRITCAYQPIFCNITNSIIKYELLLRMKDKNNKVVPPLDFLPSVKHTQVYINLTKFVVDTAMDILVNKGHNISINLDLQDILNDDIINLFKDGFKDKQNLAKNLTIEILEHEGIEDFQLIKERLWILKDLGFLIAIDDFGSGYANFRYLVDLEVDILKIDGSIIQNIDKDKSMHSIVHAIVGFSKSLGILTIAEMVETKEELEVIKDLGIDQTQGYYLGRPNFEFVEE